MKQLIIEKGNLDFFFCKPDFLYHLIVMYYLLWLFFPFHFSKWNLSHIFKETLFWHPGPLEHPTADKSTIISIKPLGCMFITEFCLTEEGKPLVSSVCPRDALQRREKLESSGKYPLNTLS